MLKEYARVFKRISIFIDALVIAACFFLSYYIRTRINSNFDYFTDTVSLLPLFVASYLMLLHYFGIYDSFRTKKAPNIFLTVLKASCAAFLVFSSFMYLLKVKHISRIFIALVFVLTSVGLFLQKLIYMAALRYARKRGYNYKSILIVGTGRRAQEFIKAIEIHSEWGLRILGLIDKDDDRKSQIISGYKVLGGFDDVPRIVHNNVIDEVVFVVPRSWLSSIQELMDFFETEGVRIHLAVDYFQMNFAKARQNELNGYPLLTFETTSDRIWHLIVKRILDIIISSLALVILSPVIALTAILIKATSDGCVLFKQIRCGINGRKFTLYKFRTMVKNAESKMDALLAHNQMKGPAFKMDNDPRLTRIGRFLRKSSLDELPQLWNVLKGDMSLVGPRPPIPKEVSIYESWHRRRLSMRPGITCLWQVNGRNRISDFNQWTKLDLYYIDNWSLALDLKIMLKTIPAVFSGAGAK